MRARVRKLVPYLLVIAASWVGSWVAADQSNDSAEQGVEDIATIVYASDLESCFRGNATLRQPLSNFFSTFYADESVEADDPEVVISAGLVLQSVEPVNCADVVPRPANARPYEPSFGKRAPEAALKPLELPPKALPHIKRRGPKNGG